MLIPKFEKIVYKYYILAFLIFSFLFSSKLFANSIEHKIVRVGWYQNSLFQDGMTDDDEDKSGYSFEYLHKIHDYTDWEYKYVYGSWTELLEKLKNGQIDILAGVPQTEEYKKDFSYPVFSMGTEKYYLYQHKSSPSINQFDLNSYNNKTIATIKGSRMTYYLEKWSDKNGVSPNIILYDDYSERDRDFSNKQVDAIIAADNNKFSKGGYHPIVKVGEEAIYLAVAKNRIDILTELNETLSMINAVDPYFLQNLLLKIYGVTISNSSLTAEELKWISIYKNLRVGYLKDYLPFCGQDSNGNATGVITDIFDQIIHTLNLKNRLFITYVPFDNFQEMAVGLNNGEINLAFPFISDSKVLKKYNIHGSTDIITVPFYVAFKGKNLNKVFDKIALNNRPIDTITKEYPDSKIVNYKTSIESLDAVQRGEATCTIMSSYRMNHLLNKGKYNNLRVFPFNSNVIYCIGIPYYEHASLSLLNKGIAFLNKAEIAGTIYRYIQSSEKYTLNDFIRDNIILVSLVFLLFFGTVITFLIIQIRKNNQLSVALGNVNILAALSQDYEAVHVLDINTGLFSTLRVSKEVNKNEIFKHVVNYEIAIREIADSYVLEDDRNTFIKKINLDVIRKRIKNESKFSVRYAVKPNKKNEFIHEVTYVSIPEDPSGSIVVIGDKCIDETLRIEREQGQYNAALLHDCSFFYEFDVTTGNIDGKFISRSGYNPLNELDVKFPVSYDDFNKIKIEKLKLEAVSEKEAVLWTCEGLINSFKIGKRSVSIRYRSNIQGIYWTATVILTEDQSNHHLHAVYICKDVTEYVETEQKNKDELQEALKKAQKASAAKSDFLSRMSHDIRTPLNGIIGLLEISEKHKDDKELLAANRQKAKVAADHLLSLINDVLDMSKLEDENTKLPYEVFNIEELISEVVTICDIKAKEAGITLLHNGEKSLKCKNVYGSKLHVRQVLLNIIINGIKYNKPNGKIFCSTELVSYDKESVVYNFKIKDTGIGISKEFLEHLYEPFTQEHDNARSRYQGTGMGMAIVKTLVEKMNGTINCESELGEGTTFSITMPFKVDVSVENEQATVEQSDVNSSIEGMNILLVEDNELNAEIAKTILEDYGASVDVAENGKIAFETFVGKDAGSYDAILMDVMMPEMNGYEATRAIRGSNKPDANSIPIIAMTANAFAEDVQNAKEAGMNAHVGKPIQVKLLLQTLAKYRNR